MNYTLHPAYRGISLDNGGAKKLLLLSRHGLYSWHREMALRKSTVTWEEIAPESFMEDLLEICPLDQSPVMVELIAKGILRDSLSPISPSESFFWAEHGMEEEDLAPVLQEKVRWSGPVFNGQEQLKEALESAGISIAADAQIGIADLDGLPFSEDWMSQTKGLNWVLFVRLSGAKPLVGPMLKLDGEGPCPICLQHRLELHDSTSKLFQLLSGSRVRAPFPPQSHPLAMQQAATVAAFELVKFLAQDQASQIQGRILELDPLTGERTHHQVVSRPQCPACGEAKSGLNPPAPIAIQAQINCPTAAGGYRTQSADRTFEQYKHHISPISGIVPQLKAYHSQLSDLIHNYTSGRNLALQSISMFWMNMHLRSANGGKGKTELQAKVGALCEAIERYSIMYHGGTYTVKGSLNTLDHALHPNSCMNYSVQQFAQRERDNLDTTQFYNLVPVPFEPDVEMEWTPVYSLTEGRFKYLPSCFCYAQYPGADEMQLYAYPDSNGAAAGNTLEEAILQGFLELVERDGAAIWWYNQVKRPQVDLSSAHNSYIDQLISFYAEQGRTLYVLDLTTDLGIPVFAALSHQIKGDRDEILYAFGAHVEAGIALERAIIELNQLLPLTDRTRGQYRIQDPVFVNWLKNVTVEHEAWLQPSPEKPKNLQTDYPDLCPRTIHDAIHFCVDTARSVGLETLVLDMTQADISMPVAKVMVPGLRHMWKRLGPGRLYDVPVKMGWLEAPKTESEMNPIGIFI